MTNRLPFRKRKRNKCTEEGIATPSFLFYEGKKSDKVFEKGGK